MTRSKLIARSVFALLGVGIIAGLLLWQVHAQYPWHAQGHYHWMPVLWLFVVYASFLILFATVLAYIVLGLMWCVDHW